MKRFIIALLIVVVLSAPLTANAEDDKEKYNEYLNSYDFSFFEKTLDKDTYAYLKSLGLSDFDFENIAALSFSDALETVVNIINHASLNPLKGMCSILLFIVVSALIKGVKGNSDEALCSAFSTATALIIALLLVSGVGATISLSSLSLSVAGNFVFAFVPVFCALVLASGAGITAFSTNSMLLILAQAISFAAANVFLPVINCFLAIGICSGLRDELHLDRLISTLKSVFTWCVSFISGAFVTVLSVKTTVASRADILGIRSARFVINSVVPVIGASISEGLLSIQSYSSLIKSSVGIVGICAVCLVFLPAVIEVVLWRMALSMCLIVSDVFCDRSVTLVLTAFRDTMLMINVVLVLSAVTTVISIGILIVAGG
ncbi:MAG: hypothetical protein IJS03_05880 [Eubacterium sp.]|nr:hypothetical protein [Eubacterium sp.]